MQSLLAFDFASPQGEYVFIKHIPVPGGHQLTFCDLEIAPQREQLT